MEGGLPSPDQIGDLFTLVKDKLTDPSTFAAPENARRVSSELSELWKPEADTRSVPNEIREFQTAFSTLLEKAKVTRLIVLVDDLDRCLPETAIETLEAIRLFVLLPKTAFIIGADEAMIEYAVRRHFPDLPEGEKWRDYPKAYLEKLIQVPFRIPAMGESETRIYVTMLLFASRIKEDSKEFDELLKHAHSLLSEPWRGRSIEETDVKTILKDRYSDEVMNSVLLGSRISSVLARGTNGNQTRLAKAISNYISRAAGGGKVSARRMASDRRAVARLGSFLSSASQNTVREALKLVELEHLADRPIREIYCELVDLVCEPGGDLDEAYTRDAYLEAINEILAEDETDLEKPTGEKVYEILEVFVTKTINNRILNAIGNQIVTLPDDVAISRSIEKQLNQFVRGAVSDAFSKLGKNLYPQVTQTAIDELYERSLFVLQTMADAEAEV